MTRKRPDPAPLEYPFADPPAPGAALEVAPGVLWIRMPLPFDLDHINLWLLRDGDGWTVVDTGLKTEETAAHWRTFIDGVLAPGKIKRIIATHMHPDHVGMAGWLARTQGAVFAMSREEYLMCRVLAADTGREPPQAAVNFYREAGWSDASIEIYRARFGRFGSQIHTLPETHLRLVDGMTLRIGDRVWRVVMANGHSPEHACLYCEKDKLLISGDQVLPRISSNVSVYPIEPEANPMADWLASIDKIRRAVAADVLVLPSHQNCFRGLHARLDELESSQHEALDALEACLKEPRRAVDVFEALFGRPIQERHASLYGMATGESIASLNYLVSQGRAKKERRDGVAWYSA
jgi:glyoxylase-like metal-dependent hydrolase (beta-lactamase superfamily II)